MINANLQRIIKLGTTFYGISDILAVYDHETEKVQLTYTIHGEKSETSFTIQDVVSEINQAFRKQPPAAAQLPADTTKPA